MTDEQELLLELAENRDLLIRAMRKVGSFEEGLMRGWLLRAKRILATAGIVVSTIACSSSTTNETEETVTGCAIVGPAPDTECAYAANMASGERWTCDYAPFEPSFRYCEEIASGSWCCL